MSSTVQHLKQCSVFPIGSKVHTHTYFCFQSLLGREEVLYLKRKSLEQKLQMLQQTLTFLKAWQMETSLLNLTICKWVATAV